MDADNVVGGILIGAAIFYLIIVIIAAIANDNYIRRYKDK